MTPEKKPPRNIGRTLLKYFLQGLFFLGPIVLTFYIIIAAISLVDKMIPVKQFDFIGRDLIIIAVVFTTVGYLSTTFVFKPFFGYLERLILNIPLAKIIYTALKDLFSAFVTEKRKFDRPVLVVMNKNSGVKKMGFITEDDVSMLSEEAGDVAVYFPHSYNFSGNLFIVPKDNVLLLKNISSSEAMKFIVSGGVTNLEVEDKIVSSSS